MEAEDATENLTKTVTNLAWETGSKKSKSIVMTLAYCLSLLYAPPLSVGRCLTTLKKKG
jgi:hypothetical protein